MKKLSVILATLLVLLSSQAFGQGSKFSAGFMTTHFSSDKSDYRFANFDNPLGVGLLLGYQINQQGALALTTEFLSGDSQDGTENIVRTHLSLVGFPGQVLYFQPYISSGVVVNFINRDNDLKTNTNVTQLQHRFGMGMDVPLFRKANLNVDFAIYGTEFRYTGWTQSIGLRYAL